MKQLATWLADGARSQPLAPALLCAEQAFNYAQLAERAAALASELKCTQRTLAVVEESALHLALVAYAASWADLPFLPLDPQLGPARHAALAEQCGANSAAVGAENGMAAVDLLIATSGSTGAAKAVMLGAANLAAAVSAAQAVLPLGAGDVWLACLPLYHVGGMMVLHRCAAAGAAVLLHQRFDVAQVWADIRSGRASHVSLTPPMLARLLDFAHGESPPKTLKCALVGGAALDATFAERARAGGWPLCLAYGMSESAAMFAVACRAAQGYAILPGNRVRISADGAIEICGPALMAGYANPDLHPGEGLTGGWFASGDAGFLDAGGRLQVIGRRDDVLVSGGVNVHPGEVEAVLAGYPGVRDVAVGALADPVWGDLVAALVVGEVDLADLEAWSRHHLAGARRPRRWFAVASLPRGALGKLQRGEVKKLLESLHGHTA